MPATKIDEIDELEDLYEIMKSFGLSTRGYKGVDDMKTKLREYLEDLEGSSKRKVGEVSQYKCVIYWFLESNIVHRLND